MWALVIVTINLLVDITYATSTPASASPRAALPSPLMERDDGVGAAEQDLLAARSTAGLLRDRAFGPYVASKLISVIGLWVHNLVAALWAYELTGSTVFVGLVSVAVFGPQLVFAIWSGVAADRGDRMRRIVLGRLICATASGGLAAYIAIAHPNDGAAELALMLASLVLGFGLVIGGPAMQSIVPTMVRPSEVAKAVTIDSLPMLLGLSIGPLLGASSRPCRACGCVRDCSRGPAHLRARRGAAPSAA